MLKLHKHSLRIQSYHNFHCQKKSTIKSEELLKYLLIIIYCSHQSSFSSSFVNLCLIHLPIKSAFATGRNFTIEFWKSEKKKLKEKLKEYNLSSQS